MIAVAAFLFLVTVTSTQAQVNVKDKEYRPEAMLYRYLRAQRQMPIYDVCGSAGEQCVPGHFRCCEGEFQCKNKFASLCLYPLEPCYCMAKPGNGQ